MAPGVFQGNTIGVFGLKSWEACRKPGQMRNSSKPSMSLNKHVNDWINNVPIPVHSSRQSLISVKEPLMLNTAELANLVVVLNEHSKVVLSQPSNISGTSNGSTNGKFAPSTPSEHLPAVRQNLIAKYNYTANALSPIGAEVSLQQGERILFIDGSNLNWWRVAKSDGSEGYVPSTYVMPLEEKVTSLPWLQNHVEEEVPAGNNRFGAPPQGTWKPYTPSFKHDGLNTATRLYYCDLCQKQLNGPKPYQAHLASKAHKEEMELQGLA